jgi:two-component system NarL family response regulator
MAIRLFILVKERVFADALAIRLDTEPDLDVVAALHTNAPPPHLCTGMVDVLLLDRDLHADTAFRPCEQTSRSRGAPRVIVLSHSADPGRIVRAIRAGAVGWVGKDESLDRLIHVIRGVARDETWLPPGQTGQVLRLLMHGPDRQSQDGTELLSALTDREREVLICLAEGIRRCDVAAHLHVSPNTVRTHLQNLMAKLGVHSAIEAVALTRAELDDELSRRRAVS